MDKKTPSVFHSCVLRRLTELGKNQQWLATKLDVAPGSVSEVLAGNPSIKKVAEYAKALDCEPWQLLKPQEPMVFYQKALPPEDPLLDRLLSLWDRLDDAERGTILRMIEGYVNTKPPSQSSDPTAKPKKG